MKRMFSALLAAVLLICFPAYAQEAAVLPDVSIKEKMFIAQCNEIYLNMEDYLGKIIELEGMMGSWTDDTTGKTYNMVFRAGPGCCGNDGTAGFEVIWPEGSTQGYPQSNAWVHAVGELESYEEAGTTYLHLVLIKLEEMAVRGAEFVSQ